MRKLLVLVLVLILVFPLAIPFAGVSAADPVSDRLAEYNASLPAGYGNVSVADLAAVLIDNPDLFVLDVRQPEEYEAGHIPGAVNIPIRELAQRLDMLPDLDMEMVVYCGSGFRSAMAMTALQILGYTDARNMGGGMGAWEAEEYAVDTEVPEAVMGEAPAIDETVWKAVNFALNNIPEGWGAVKAENLNVELVESPPDILIDVRASAEWVDGYIFGAVSMPLEELMSFAREWPTTQDANIVVYCKAGHRGQMAATILRVFGYTNVRNLAGGFTAWATAELPVEMPEAGDAVLFALSEFNESLPAGYGNISVTDLSAEMIDNPALKLVDVRQPEEYEAGHLPGAVNISLRELAQRLDALPDLDEKMVVYCGSGFRSAMAMTALQILGFTDVRNMSGGVKSWEAEEFGMTTDVTEAELGEAPAIDADVLAAVDAALMGIPEGWGAVKAEDLNVELVETAPDLLIDVRTPAEWEEGYIPGAVHMPLEQLVSFVNEWPEAQDANVVVYCKSGHRGQMAATILRAYGYTNVRNLAGGFTAWATAELPVEMP